MTTDAKIEPNQMPKRLYNNHASNIYARYSKQPTPNRQTSPDDHLTIGDLHGNTFKLLHALIENNVLVLDDKNDYSELNRIYQRFGRDLKSYNKDTFNADLQIFNTIIEKAKLNSIDTLELIGDDLSDRGNCDLLTLLLIYHLSTKENKPKNLHILLSNHGIEFILQAEKLQNFQSEILNHDYNRSMKTVGTLVNSGLIDKKIFLTFTKTTIKNIYA